MWVLKYTGLAGFSNRIAKRRVLLLCGDTCAINLFNTKLQQMHSERNIVKVAYVKNCANLSTRFEDMDSQT